MESDLFFVKLMTYGSWKLGGWETRLWLPTVFLSHKSSLWFPGIITVITAAVSSLEFMSGCKEVNKGILRFEAAKIYCLGRRGETHGSIVLSPWRLGREQCTPKDSCKSFGVSVYIDLLVRALVGCEVKSMWTVLICSKLTKDLSKHFWTLEGGMCNRQSVYSTSFPLWKY